MINWINQKIFDVHGGIRHLEIAAREKYEAEQVHGGIRHLEIPP